MDYECHCGRCNGGEEPDEPSGHELKTIPNLVEGACCGTCKHRQFDACTRHSQSYECYDATLHLYPRPPVWGFCQYYEFTEDKRRCSRMLREISRWRKDGTNGR